MKKIIFMILLLLLSACDNSSKEEVSEVSEKKVEKKVEKIDKRVNLNTPEDFLQQLGLEINGEKITIDINRTTEFMENLETKMQHKADEIEKKIEKSEIDFTEGMGIEITDDKVAIDLNKTRDMLQQINILMKDIILDVNNTID